MQKYNHSLSPLLVGEFVIKLSLGGVKESTLSMDETLLLTFEKRFSTTSSSSGSGELTTDTESPPPGSLNGLVTANTLNLELLGEEGNLSGTFETWKRLLGAGLHPGEGIGDGFGDFIRVLFAELSNKIGGAIKRGSQLNDTFLEINLDKFICSSTGCSANDLFTVHMPLIF